MLLKVPKGGKEPSLPVVVTPCLDFAGFARWGCQVFKRVENPVSTEKRGDKKKMIRRVEQKENDYPSHRERERQALTGQWIKERSIAAAAAEEEPQQHRLPSISN